MNVLFWTYDCTTSSRRAGSCAKHETAIDRSASARIDALTTTLTFLRIGSSGSALEGARRRVARRASDRQQLTARVIDLQRSVLDPEALPQHLFERTPNRVAVGFGRHE